MSSDGTEPKFGTGQEYFWWNQYELSGKSDCGKDASDQSHIVIERQPRASNRCCDLIGKGIGNRIHIGERLFVCESDRFWVLGGSRGKLNETDIIAVCVMFYYGGHILCECTG